MTGTPEPELSYVEAPHPIDGYVGWYRVDLGDMVYMSPTRYRGLLDEEEYREALIDSAIRTRDWRYIVDQFE